MFYVKNLPTWERVVRLAGAAVMALCCHKFGLTPVGIVFGVTAAVTGLTALFGFCPMCAFAGRRIKAQQD